MLPSHCLVCNAVNRYNQKVNEIRRIKKNIQMMLTKYDRKDILEIKNPNIQRGILNDHQHQHFMCGTCVKVNLSTLRNEESELKKYLSKIAYLIEDSQLSTADYHLLLRLLSGYYPVTFHTFERLWATTKKN